MFIHFLNILTAILTNQPEFKHVANLSECTGSHHQCPTSTQILLHGIWKQHKLSMQDMRFSKWFYAGFMFSGIWS